MNRYFFALAATWIAAAPVAAAVQFGAPSLAAAGAGDTKVVVTVGIGPMGAPSGFTIEWMEQSDYIAHGGWFEPEEAYFFGVPTLNAWGAPDSYSPDREASFTLEIGDLFDETGVSSTSTQELAGRTLYVLRAYVNADDVIDRSDYSSSVTVTTTGDEDCTHTQGYWKNHEEEWSGVSLELGMVTYSATELDEIFETPAGGNGSLILAHQLISALLNQVVLGADVSPIQDAIDDAHALLDTCGLDPIPPHGTCFIDPSEASPIAQILDDFNNTSDGNCATAVESKTWGSVKAAYR